MNRRVVLSLGTGSLSSGFPHVIAQLWENEKSKPIQCFGQLPVAPEIMELYIYWQASYWAQAKYEPVEPCRIQYEDSGSNHLSELSLAELRQSLSLKIDTWLNSESFREVDQQLRKTFSADDEIEFIIETGDRLLRRLPWHVWNFFIDYPKAEVALSAPKYERSNKTVTIFPGNRVRILAVFGDKTGIDTDKDQALIKAMCKQSDIKCLSEPSREKLYEEIEKGWHILFFAGHSYSKTQGIIQLNQTDSLSLSELSNSLRTAISKGLKLAIFNSCDGLGLAEALENLHIPQVIVMREPVPDVVAQEFLKRFLESFSSGQSLCSSVRQGREHLQKLEFQYPCATWLPVVCRNPSEEPITWQELCGRIDKSSNNNNNSSRQQNHQHLFNNRGLFQATVISTVLVAALVIGARYLGWLQSWELKAFDQSLRLRPDEPPDPRLLIITITEDDLKLKEEFERKGSLTDKALAPLLRALDKYEPIVIGLDVYRDFAVGPYQSDLRARMQNQKNLIVVCKGLNPNDKNPGMAPPEEVKLKKGGSSDELQNRIGFSDIVNDGDGINENRVLRRYLLAVIPSPASPCPAYYSFSAQLASYYLEKQGIARQYTRSKELQLRDVIFKRLKPHMGPYQKTDVNGYQFIINYRSSNKSPLEIAPKLTLTQVLHTDVNLANLKNRIIIVGTTATSVHDYLSSPYGEIPGVIAQAQMVSQITSAVLNHRPLLSFWPFWTDCLWVFAWSFAGGSLIWIFRFRPPFYFWLAIAGSELCLFVACMSILVLSAYVVPLVPAGLGLVATSGSVAFFSSLSSLMRSREYWRD